MAVKRLILIFALLFFGVLIYLLFRTPLSWFPIVGGWDGEIISLSRLPAPLSSFVKYHLSDVLWGLSFAEAVYLIKGNWRISFAVVIAITALLNISQHFKIVKGTCDILDIIYVACFLAIYIIIKNLRRRKNGEKI